MRPAGRCLADARRDTVVRMIEVDEPTRTTGGPRPGHVTERNVVRGRDRCRLVGRGRTALAALAVMVAPTAFTLLAAPSVVRAAPPVGTAVWRADPRHLPDPVSADPVAV